MDRIKIAHQHGGMSLPGRAKLVFNAEVKLLLAEGKPDVAPASEDRRLLDFGQAEDASVETACGLLGAGRHCQLDVVQP